MPSITTTHPLWRDFTHTDTSMTFYPRTTATWEQQQEWLEKTYTDRHWTWRGFGEMGTEEFKVVLYLRACWRRKGEGAEACAWCDPAAANAEADLGDESDGHTDNCTCNECEDEYSNVGERAMK